MHRLLVIATLLTCPNIVKAEDDQAAPEFTLSEGQHITIIGNTLAERMQHDGWLEALIQSRFPDKELVVRNLGFSADELTVRMRVDGFGSQKQWLSRTKANIIFAFFGFNESFAGEAGLTEFKTNLNKFIELTLDQKYNAAGPPILVLFSPIAHEDLKDDDLSDGAENNKRIQMYSQAMEEVAKARNVFFVDLFTPTRIAAQVHASPLTINGIHLNSTGNRVVAEIIEQALFPGDATAPRNEAQLEKIRLAVVDKNFFWFHRYQTTDGYNVHGGRSRLSFNDISNLEVMQREMEILDSMTANRDGRIWAVAQESDLKIDDESTPAFIPVTTNLPGDGPDGSHLFLSGEQAIQKMSLAEGMQVNLFASEEQFPELINPVQMAFDTQGRLFVAAWPSYPHWKPKDEMNDKLLILEDNDGDGHADQCTTFADHLHNPTGFEFWGGGVIVAMAPDVLFLKDTDGDNRADVRTRILHGISSGDTHHTINSFVFDPGGALYFQEGIFHRTQIETPYGPVRNNDACVWRFEPRSWKIERYIPFAFANPHGHVFDDWGQGFVHDGTFAMPFHDTLFSGHIDFPDAHPKPPVLYERRTRPCPATEILSSSHFPDENQGNLLVANVIGVLGILAYEFHDKDSSFTAIETTPILQSSDHNFRPADIEIGPDGAIWFVDWQNPIIGHMQHHVRDPNRDQQHGRVYRITYPSRPLLDPPKISNAPLDELLDLLKSDESRVRYRTRIELSNRDTDEVIAGVDRWLTELQESDPQYEHHMLEGLWVHQQHHVVNEQLLKRMLRSPDYRARAAATRVLGYWRDDVKEPLELLTEQVADEHPRVRLEAVRACSFFKQADAMDVATAALEHPVDDYLLYTLDQTVKTLEKYFADDER